MTTTDTPVTVSRVDLRRLLAFVNLAQREENDWRGALDDADAILTRLLGDEPETRCPDCGEWGETAGHMECQYPRDH